MLINPAIVPRAVTLRRYLRSITHLVPGGTLVEQAVKSGIWAGLTSVVAQGLTFGRLLVLAALLSPADFGLMGVALITIAAFKQFTELGVNDALVQRREADVSPYLDTAWLLNVARGVLILAVMWVGAPFIADFFGEGRATPLLRVVGVLPLLTGLQNPAIVYFQKNLGFHKRFVHQVSGALAGAVVGVAWAFVFRDVWALVWGALAREAVMLVVSYSIADYRPRVRPEVARAREIIGFGKWITGLSILVFLTTQGDDVFVGWLLGATALGFYQFAYQLSNTPATQVTGLVSSVAFPTYSKLQDDLPALREGYFRVLKLVTFVSVPITVGTVLTAETFVRGYLGEQWLPAVPAVQILAVWGLVRATGSTSGPLFKAMNRPDIITKIQFVKLVLIAAFIWPAAERWGVEGVAFVIVGNALLVSEPAVYYLLSRELGASPWAFVRTLGMPAAAGAVTGAVVYLTRESLAFAPVVEFPLLVAAGAVTYVTLAVVMEHLGYGIRPIVTTIARAVS